MKYLHFLFNQSTTTYNTGITMNRKVTNQVLFISIPPDPYLSNVFPMYAFV
jgi:hypothetical protein